MFHLCLFKTKKFLEEKLENFLLERFTQTVSEPNRLSGKILISVQPLPITGMLLDTELTVHVQLLLQDIQEQSFKSSATSGTKLARILFNGMKVENLSPFSALPKP